jgi:hypothetical protein
MRGLWKCAAFALFAIGLTAQEPSRAVRVQKAAVPPAGQETRVALVIGNGAYQASPLKNPVNDARAMDEPGVIIEQSLKEVFAGVKLASHGRQEPWQEGGLEGNFFFRPGGQVPGAAAVSTLPPPPVAVAQVGGLQVSVNAPDAKVYVDGALKGTASPISALNLPDLPAGDVQVRVEAPGYTLAQQGFSIEPGRWTQAEIRLAKAQPETPQIPVNILLPGGAQESRLIGTVWHFQWSQPEILATQYFRLLRNGSMAYGKMADLSDSKIDATDQWSLQGGVLVVEWSDRYATERFTLGIDWPVGTTLPGTIISKKYSGFRDCTLTRIQ